MKQAKIFGGICAAVAMLIGAGAYAASTVIGTITVPRGPQGEPGVGITYKGEVDNCTELGQLTGMIQGDAYYNRDEGLLYIYNGTAFPTCPGGGVPFKGEQGEQGPVGPQGPQGTAGQDACIPAFTSSHNDATRKTTVRYTCGNTDESFEIADGAEPCTPSFTSAYNSTARKTTVQYVCGSTNQSFEIADGNNGAGICDGVANAATAVKTYTKTYTAHTTTAAGYVTLEQTMCDNITNNTIYEDTCVPIVPTRTAQNICSNGTYMECTPQNGGNTYNICKTVTSENAQSIGAAIGAAQSAADNAQSTATTTANKVDNNTTGLAATYSLASQANTAAANAQSTADSKISKNATFSTNTQTGYIVLTDGDTTKNVVALADIKGEKGDKGCNSFSVAPNPGQSSETAVAYDIICND